MSQGNLFQLFIDVANRNRKRPALRLKSATLTYEELLENSLKMATLLADSGICQGDVIWVCAEKSSALYALQLASLNLGAPHVFLDFESPLDRQRKMIQACEPALLVAEERLFERGLADVGEKFRLKMASIEAFEAAASGCAPRSLSLPGPHGGVPAYITFTSGTTGFPKGAVITHQNLLRLIAWCRDYFSFGPGDVLTGINFLCFDGSVFDFYAAVFAGATLAPFTREEAQNPLVLVEETARRGCTSWFSVPSVLMYLDSMRLLEPDVLPDVNRFIFGGEGYPMPRLKKLFDLFADRADIVNMYGPTECTCICAAHRMVEEDFRCLEGYPPLGRLTPDFSGIIVDADCRPVEEGTRGELLLSGPCVGPGYYNDKERTQRLFRQNPLHDHYTDIVYHTGDVVHQDPVNGMLYIHGRVDNQVQHRGYRVELEEIENALWKLPGVRQAAAIHTVRKGSSFIGAALCVDIEMDDKRVMARLKERLPGYMLPTSVHFLDALPKNPNDKLDRQAIHDLIFPKSTGTRT